MFKDARRALDCLEAAEKRVRQKRKCDWSSEGEVAEYRHERRTAARILDLPRDMVCPVCKERKLSPRRWVVLEGISCCRGCFQRQSGEKEVVTEGSVLSAERADKWRVTRTGMLRGRGERSLREVATLCGWSVSRQHTLERGGLVTEETMKSLVGAGWMRMVFMPEPKWSVTRELRRTRKATGCSRREFARRCGWSSRKQAKLEASEIPLRGEDATILMCVMRSIGITLSH